MGNTKSKQPPYTLQTTFPNYKGAGILFANNRVALAGVQKHRRLAETGGTGILSGLGGRRELSDMDWYYTAWREVIEELYNESIIPAALIMELCIKIPLTTKPLYINEYVMCRLSFEQLEYMMRICAKSKYKLYSNVYEKLPLSLTDLIMKRLPTYNTEIGALSLIPSSHPVTIADEFIGDLIASRV